MTNQLQAFLQQAYGKWGERNYLFEKKDNVFSPITFGTFIEQVNWLGAYLIRKGFKDQNIGIYGPNSVEWMIADIAVMCYVGCSVGLSKDWSYDNVVYAVKKCELSCLIYDERQAECVEKLRKEFPQVTFLSMQKDFFACLKEGEKLCDGLFSIEPKSDDVPAKVVFTSGTTSFPKAVLLSIRNVFSGWKSLRRRVPFGEQDRCYLFLPLNHTYGSIYNFIYSLVFGYEVYLAGSISDMAQEMMEVHPTIFSGVPIIYMRFYEAAKDSGIGLQTLFGGSMKYLFCGGAKLYPHVRDAYRAEGMYMMNAYALSETSSGFSIDYPNEEDMESVGTLFEDIEAVVFDPDEEGYGELAVKGDNVFKGYFHDDEATKAAFSEDGYFLTGDIGCIRDGKVYLKGRKDTRLTLPNGENVSAKMLEQRVCELHESVAAAKVYVRNDKLTVDIYVKDSELLQDKEMWEKLVEGLNSKVSRYERIGMFNLYSSEKLLK